MDHWVLFWFCVVLVLTGVDQLRRQYLKPVKASEHLALSFSIDQARTHPSDTSACPKQTQATQRRWAVFLSTEGVLTPGIKQLAAIESWSVLVVAAKPSTPAVCAPNVIYLGWQQQQQLGYSILKHLPPHGSGRKNVGYIYAIAHGAEVVYDADEQSTLLQDFVGSVTCEAAGGGVNDNAASAPCLGKYAVLDTHAKGSKVFNPFTVVGLPHVSPRGMPELNIKATEQLCFSSKVARPLVQQSLTQGHLDVLNGHCEQQHASLDDTAFPVVLPTGVVAPINRYNTLFSHDALWGLLLPKTADSVSDVLRGYVAQRLLWDIGGNLAITHATAHRHTPFNKTTQDTPLVDTLLPDVLAVQLKSSTLPGRLIELYQHLGHKGGLQQVNFHLLGAWLSDLRGAKYVFPELREHPGAPENPLNGSHPDPHFVFMKHWCMHVDKVLYINFNLRGHVNLPARARLLHAVYRPMFRRVVFAGAVSMLQPQALTLPSTLHKCDHVLRGMNPAKPTGFFAHVCLADFLTSDAWSITAGPGNVGVFYTNDDVVFSPCMLSGLNRTKIWYDSPLINPKVLKKESAWHWGEKFASIHNSSLKKATIAALQQSYGLMGERVQERLQGGELFYSQGQADVFYLPAQFLLGFATMAQQMHAHRIITEVAVPNILGLLKGELSDSETVPVVFAWVGSDRTCLVDTVSKSLPLEHNISCHAVRCVGLNASNVCSLPGIFAVHPYKLSNPSVASRWLTWWKSQACGA